MTMVAAMKEYPKQIERFMCRLYFSLSEKDQRYYAAVEAMKLGHGGVNYISDFFGCCRQTVATGIEELKKMTSQTHLECAGPAEEESQ